MEPFTVRPRPEEPFKGFQPKKPFTVRPIIKRMIRLVTPAIRTTIPYVPIVYRSLDRWDRLPCKRYDFTIIDQVMEFGG